MNIIEKRKYPRVKIHNLISYICLDNDGRPIKNLMGTALDISQGGLLLETTQRIEPGDIILITADEQDQIIEINARATYCREMAGGKFCVGVSFQGAQDKNIQFVSCMVRSYHYCKASAQST
jgi:c-di-GMP-binding flagellar brake protein YcgR